jgi:hypothetical protein
MKNTFGIISIFIGGLLGIIDILGIFTYSTIAQKASADVIVVQIFIAMIAWFYIHFGYKVFKLAY